MDLENFAEDQVKAPGRRLIQLALNDAVQSRLCLISPIKSQMEREKRDRRKVNKITVWTESNSQNSSFGTEVFVRESRKGFRTCAPESKWNSHLNKSLHNAISQSGHMPSSQHAFYNGNKNEISNQYTRNNNNSPIPYISSNLSSGDMLFSSGPSKIPDMMPTFSENNCNRRDVESNATFFDYKGNNVSTLMHHTSVNSQPNYLSYSCVERNIPTKQTDTESSLMNYDLPLLSQSCGSSDSNWFEGRISRKKDDSVSEIPKMSPDLLNHLSLHSLENSLRYPSKESLTNFIQPPVVRSHCLKFGVQNDLSSSEVEIPAPSNTLNQIYSPKFYSIQPTEEKFASYTESSTYNDKRSVNNNAGYLENNSISKIYPLKSDPHFSTFKHFKDLIYDDQETHSSLITVTTDNLEVKIVSNRPQLDNSKMECPISKPKKTNADYLVDSFLNLIPTPMHDDVSSSFTDAVNNGITFNDNLHSKKTDDYICRPQCNNTSNPFFKSNHEKNNPGKLTSVFPDLHSSNLLQHFPNYDIPLSHKTAEVSSLNPCRNDSSINSDKPIYPRNFDALRCCSDLPAPMSETLNDNHSDSKAKFSTSANSDYSLFDTDVSIDHRWSSKSDILPSKHLCDADSEHFNETDTLYSNCKDSKLGRAVDMLNSSSLHDNFRLDSNYHKDSVSDYEDSALKPKSLRNTLGSSDSGIGLIMEDRECNSIWDLPLMPSK